jgi:hypothetical protein
VTWPSISLEGILSVFSTIMGDKPIARSRWNWPARCFWLKDEDLPGGRAFGRFGSVTCASVVIRWVPWGTCEVSRNGQPSGVRQGKSRITEQHALGPSETFTFGLYTDLTSYFLHGILKRLQIFRQWCKHVLKGKAIPVNRPWRLIGLWDVEAPTLSRQSGHRWRWGCQPYEPAALYPKEYSWYSFLLEAESTPGP